MCGIITVFETRGEENQLRPEVLKMSKKIRHRGPDSVSYTHLRAHETD